MAGKGPAPKPAHLRQRTNRKPGAAVLEAPASPKIPELPNPDGRDWHALTIQSWRNAWGSPMAGQWLDTDRDALGRLALLWDAFYKAPDSKVLAEVRLQEARFGLSPIDRSRLQWEVQRAEERDTRPRSLPTRPASGDPRRLFMAVSK
jgi:hypothetical protein